MLNVFGKIPKNVPIGLAFSGGRDSSVVLDFLLDKNNRKSKREIILFHFNHGTEHGKVAEEFARKVSEKYNLELHVSTVVNAKPKGMSEEAFWHEERYRFFHSFPEIPIITAHHLSDVVETYLMSSLKGSAKLMGYSNGNIIRPFLGCSKKEIDRWAEKNEVEFVQDYSNFENVHDRNIVRNELLPIVLKVNPGIEKTVKKLLMEKLNEPRR